MRKLILMTAILIGTAAISQERFLIQDDKGFLKDVQNSNRLVGCTSEEVSTNVTIAQGNTAINEVADNFTVAADSRFIVENGYMIFIASPDADLGDLTVRFYDDNGASLPNTLLAEEIVVGDLTNLGSSFLTDFDVFQVDFTFTEPITLEGQMDQETMFWVSGFTPDSNGPNTYIEIIDETTDTVSYARKLGDDPAAPWVNMYTSGDAHYAAIGFSISGQCEELLEVTENLAHLVSIFPNPATDILKITVPSTVELNGVVLYDVLGKATNVTLTNGQINVASLSRGMYILNVSTSAGTLTEKVIIE